MNKEPVWPWIASLILFVALGYTFKSVVLNWVIGPIFPLVTLFLIPRALGLWRDPSDR
jgi:hypothetical protein